MSETPTVTVGGYMMVDGVLRPVAQTHERPTCLSPSQALLDGTVTLAHIAEELYRVGVAEGHIKPVPKSARRKP